MSSRPPGVITTGPTSPMLAEPVSVKQGIAESTAMALLSAARLAQHSVSKVKKGCVLYTSTKRNLMVNISVPQNRVTRDGEKVVLPFRIARFTDAGDGSGNGMFIAEDEESIQALDRNKNCRIGGLYWRAEDLRQAASQASKQALRDLFRSNSSLREQALEFITEAEMDSAPQAATGTMGAAPAVDFNLPPIEPGLEAMNARQSGGRK